MAKPMRIKAVEKDGIVNVKVIMRHAMETGLRKDSSGKKIPALHITGVSVKHKDKVVSTAEFGASVSKNPFFHVRFKGGVKGDTITVSWEDNSGKSASSDAKIK